MKWGLKTDESPGRSSMNKMAVEGLLSMSRGPADRPFQLVDLSEFRNAVSGEGGDQTGRRMSITNAMDILRDRLLRAIKVTPHCTLTLTDQSHSLEETRQPGQQGGTPG